jgi:hypothetical protein
LELVGDVLVPRAIEGQPDEPTPLNLLLQSGPHPEDERGTRETVQSPSGLLDSDWFGSASAKDAAVEGNPVATETAGPLRQDGRDSLGTLVQEWPEAEVFVDPLPQSFVQQLVQSSDSPVELIEPGPTEPDDPFIEEDKVGVDEDSDADEESARRRLMLKHLAELKKPMSEISVGATFTGRVPERRSSLNAAEDPPIVIRSLGFGPPPPVRYTIGFRHRPLYYEQPNLERCGRGFGCLQNAVSAGQFVANTMFLPYHLCSEPAACLVPAGGDCMTCQPIPVDCHLFPLDHRAVLTQSATLAGFSFLLL